MIGISDLEYLCAEVRQIARKAGAFLRDERQKFDRERIGIICLIPMVLVILISILLYIPPFQNFAVRLATEYASETTGMNIRIGQIRLSFPLNLTIRDVKVITPPDTLLSLDQVASIGFHAAQVDRIHQDFFFRCAASQRICQ